MQKLKFLPFSNFNSSISNEEVQRIIELLVMRNSMYLNQEIFEIETGWNNDQMQINICLKNIDNSIVYPIEIICIHEDFPNLNPSKIFEIIMDYMDIYWSEYLLNERNLFVPLDWAQYEANEIQFYLRGFIRNIKLEKQAEYYLNEYGMGEFAIAPISSET